MRFRELTLQAEDPDKAAAWYREVLGLPAAAAARSIVAGATVVRFEAAPPGTQPRYHFAFNVPENRIEDALAWARDRAPLFEDDGSALVDYASWDAHAVYFEDVAGNVVELIARHALPNRSTRPFDGSSLLEVSEVGLPCHSVPDLAARLRRALGVGDYRPPNERFAPLGDERGLLILVREGRAWFPTAAEARPFPLRVVHDGPAFDVEGLPYRFLSAGAARAE